VVSVWPATVVSVWPATVRKKQKNKQFRSVDYPYGLPKGILTPRQVEQVRLGTYFAFQSANFLREAHGRGVGFAIETPEPRQGVVSVFTLPELVALSNSE
jgi:hypothetical protein